VIAGFSLKLPIFCVPDVVQLLGTIKRIIKPKPAIKHHPIPFSHTDNRFIFKSSTIFLRFGDIYKIKPRHSIVKMGSDFIHDTLKGYFDAASFLH
jgi:hypothetical protein